MRLLAWLWSFRRDNCEVCHGKRGGVRGNENRLDGVVMCDFCTADVLRERWRRVGRCQFCGNTDPDHPCGRIL